MKKILFITPLMVVSLLASCGNNNPQTTDEYTVTEQEMKDAYAMKGVEYLQATDVASENGLETSKITMAFTPTSNNEIHESPSYYEKLIIEDGDGENYHQYERSDKEKPFTPTKYTGNFQTISEFANETFRMVKGIKYEDYYYDMGKKEYMTYAVVSGRIGVAFIQFYNKQVSKLTYLNYVYTDRLMKDEISFSYDKIEPPSPTI